MFTTDGELREEYREMLNRQPEKPAGDAVEPPTAAPAATAGAERPDRPASGRRGPAETRSRAARNGLRCDLSGSPGAACAKRRRCTSSRPPTCRSSTGPKCIELARMHIDLLVILKAKTAGNLDAHGAIRARRRGVPPASRRGRKDLSRLDRK